MTFFHPSNNWLLQSIRAFKILNSLCNRRRNKQTWECSPHVLRDFFHHKLIQFSISSFLFPEWSLSWNAVKWKKKLFENQWILWNFEFPLPFHQSLIPLKKKRTFKYFLAKKYLKKSKNHNRFHLWERQKT